MYMIIFKYKLYYKLEKESNVFVRTSTVEFYGGSCFVEVTIIWQKKNMTSEVLEGSTTVNALRVLIVYI